MTAREARALMARLDRQGVERAIREIYGADADTHLYIPLIAPLIARVREPATPAESAALMNYTIAGLRR